MTAVFQSLPAVFRGLQLGLLLSLSGLAGGCASMITDAHTQKEPLVSDYLSGRTEPVKAELDRRLDEEDGFNADSAGTDELMWRLESGSFYFHAKDYQRCLDELQTAERLIEEYDLRATVSLRDSAAEGLVLITNLNALPYRGFGRDRILLSVYKALAYLGCGRYDAFRVQLRRLRQEQKLVRQKYQEFFAAEDAALKQAQQDNPELAEQTESEAGSPEKLAAYAENGQFAEAFREADAISKRGYGDFLNPLAIFLSGLGNLLDGNAGNAKIDFDRLHRLLPNNRLIGDCRITVSRLADRNDDNETEDTDEGMPFAIDRNCLYVIFAIGRTAALHEVAIEVPIMTAYPVCEFYQSPFRSAVVSTGALRRRAELLADMDGILAQEFQERLPGMITRIVLSTLVKEAAYYGAIAAISSSDMDDSAKEAALLVTALGGAAYRSAVNTADTRTWELIPKEFRLAILPMPQERWIEFKLSGSAPVSDRIAIPESCDSAIVYIGAFSPENLSVHVFPLTETRSVQ